MQRTRVGNAGTLSFPGYIWEHNLLKVWQKQSHGISRMCSKLEGHGSWMWMLSIVCCFSLTAAWECGWERLLKKKQKSKVCPCSLLRLMKRTQTCCILYVMAQNGSQPKLESVYEVSWTRRWGKNPVAFVEAFLLWLVYFLKLKPSYIIVIYYILY